MTYFISFFTIVKSINTYRGLRHCKITRFAKTVTPQGFEPQFLRSERKVLPLDDGVWSHKLSYFTPNRYNRLCKPLKR